MKILEYSLIKDFSNKSSEFERTPDYIRRKLILHIKHDYETCKQVIEMVPYLDPHDRAGLLWWLQEMWLDD